MKTYKIDDIFSEKVDKGSLFVLRTNYTSDTYATDLIVSHMVYKTIICNQNLHN